MHDCQATKARLLDLVCGEAADAGALRAEVGSCDACDAERRALSEIFRAFDGASREARPPEDFWPGYHARLARRLAAADRETAPVLEEGARNLYTRSRPAPFAARLRRALTKSWSVPAPVALAAVLLIACLTPLALLRPPAVNVAPTHQGGEPAVAAPERLVQTIEVPVVREKVVTRTVYVTRPSRRRARATRAGGDAGLASESSPLPAVTAPGRDTLTGFRPAGDVRLRVIKGRFENER